MAELKLHLDAGAFVGTDGDQVGLSLGTGFPDTSGYGREFRYPGVDGAAPVFSSTVMNGLPGVVFSGNHWLTGGGVLGQYYGATEFAVLCVFKARTLVAPVGSHVYEDPAVYCDSGGFTGLFLNNTPVAQGYVFDGGDKSRSRTIATNQVVVAAFTLSGGQLTLAVNGGTPSSVSCGAPGSLAGVLRLGRNHVGGQWFNGAIAELLVWTAVPPDYTEWTSSLLGKYGVQRLAGLEMARDVGSRHLREFRREKPTPRLVVSLATGLGLSAGSYIPVSHPEFPHPQGLGAGVKPWQAWLCRVLRRTVRAAAGDVELILRRHFPLSLWWVPHTPLSGLALQQGVARILSGQSWTYTRPSVDYVEDPTDGHVIEVPIDAEPLDRGGFLAQGARTNVVLNSSAAEGLAWWTTTGVTLDQGDQLFDPGITPQSFKLTADTPLVTGAVMDEVLGGTPAQYWAVGVDHKDDSGHGLAVGIRRASDNKWLAAAPATWQVAETHVFLPTRATPTRDFVLVDAGSATTLRVKPKAVAAAGQVAHVYHVQVEAGRWPTSRIVTRSSPATRAAGQLLISNDAAARVLNAAHGTIRFVFVPWCNSADLGSSTLTLLWLPYNGSNSIRVWYDGATSAWKFTRVVGGVSTTASKAGTLTRGTPVDGAVRWTGPDLELDLAAYTQSVVVDGVRGTDATAGGAPAEVATCSLEVGSGSSATAEGWIRRLLITPQVLLDEELARPD